MQLLLETTATSNLPFNAIFVLGLGFIAAAFIGSIAWYNSKRPIGWKTEERPDVIPKVNSYKVNS
ncbi:photosystem II assembly protein Psb35 [Spirulina sp. 06S082]|uniref:photosystem II assembly protein Psb35 n=1 Tax=Spirulina sp. 06S082 TaxID=3110248 RepID=UPI002B1EF2D2|nr:hypothetical protein [Spirulina sp. 06S082]MEA5471567.1 hypothetical protein [Spirulina sp. 06S082]